MQVPEIIKNISTLPLMQRIFIIENVLQTVKNDVLKQIETNQADNIQVFYQIFLLNNQMRKYLGYYDIVHVSQTISQNAIDLIHRFHLSHNLQIPDSIIGATAIAHNISLFTYNTKDFKFMPNIELYQDNK